MKRFSCLSLAAFALSGLFLAARPALARDLAGVSLPDTLSAGDKTLKLNGLGLRKKAIFKVYVGGLYLEAPSKDAAAIVAADAPKAVRMHFLRDLEEDAAHGGVLGGLRGEREGESRGPEGGASTRCSPSCRT